MNLISTSWTCQRCGGAFISTPPESGLCEDCVRQGPCTCPHPQTADVCPDALVTCAECGGPVCPDCGQRLLLLVPVASYTQLVDGAEVSGDGG
jgi:hypothetical protein